MYETVSVLFSQLLDIPGTPLVPELDDDSYLLSYLIFDDQNEDIPLLLTDALKYVTTQNDVFIVGEGEYRWTRINA